MLCFARGWMLVGEKETWVLRVESVVVQQQRQYKTCLPYTTSVRVRVLLRRGKRNLEPGLRLSYLISMAGAAEEFGRSSVQLQVQAEELTVVSAF